jgi:hypothetical protein
VRWRAHWSFSSGHSRVRELASEGAKERGGFGEPVSALTGARAVVWWPGDDNEAAAGEDSTALVFELRGRGK